MEEAKKHKCASTGALCDFCEHSDYKKNQIQRCHEAGNRYKDVRLFNKHSVSYNSRAFRSRHKGFGVN